MKYIRVGEISVKTIAYRALYASGWNASEKENTIAESPYDGVALGREFAYAFMRGRAIKFYFPKDGKNILEDHEANLEGMDEDTVFETVRKLAYTVHKHIMSTAGVNNFNPTGKEIS